MSGKKRPAFPALYATIYRMLVDVGAEHGYAMALHGSLARDLDVIACPWTEEAASADELVEAICERVGLFADYEMRPESRALEAKPHGRRSWALLLTAGAYVDLSIMPRGDRA